MPARCPECNAAVEEGALACSNCPASWEEEGEDYHRPVRKHKYVDGPVVWVGLLGACVFLAWIGITKFLEIIDPDNAVSPVKTFVDNRVNQLDPAVARATQGGAKDLREAAVSQNSSMSMPAKPSIKDEDEAPLPVEADATVWRLRGNIMDLTTLAPVPKATLIFEDAETGRRRESSTDDQGRYRVSVPPLQGRGYYVRIKKDGYAPSYLNPGTENVPQMPAEDRASLAADVARSLDGPYTVQAYNSDPLTTDFYLAPKKNN